MLTKIKLSEYIVTVDPDTFNEALALEALKQRVVYLPKMGPKHEPILSMTGLKLIQGASLVQHIENAEHVIGEALINGEYAPIMDAYVGIAGYHDFSDKTTPRKTGIYMVTLVEVNDHYEVRTLRLAHRKDGTFFSSSSRADANGETFNVSLITGVILNNVGDAVNELLPTIQENPELEWMLDYLAPDPTTGMENLSL